MTELLGVPNGSVALNTPVASIIGPFRRRRTWRCIEAELNLRLPELIFPGWFGLFLNVVAWAPATATWIWIDATGRGGWFVLLAFVAGMSISLGLGWLAKPLALAVPPNCLSMRDLVRNVVGLNHGRLVEEFGPSTDRELRKALEYLIRELTGLDYYWLEGEDLALCELTGEE